MVVVGAGSESVTARSALASWRGSGDAATRGPTTRAHRTFDEAAVARFAPEALARAATRGRRSPAGTADGEGYEAGATEVDRAAAAAGREEGGACEVERREDVRREGDRRECDRREGGGCGCGEGLE